MFLLLLRRAGQPWWQEVQVNFGERGFAAAAHNLIHEMNVQIAANSNPHVLVIGGGFGGVAVVKALSDAAVKISLIDRSNHHVFQPLLYQVATSALTPTDIATPLREIFRNQKNVTVFLGEVTAIDLEARTFSAEGEIIPLPFDFLVIAAGAEQSYFGHDEFSDFAPGLKCLSDAKELRNKILTAFENAERKLEPSAHPELTTFVLVGGGPTGVELSAAIADLGHRTLKADFRRFDPTKLRVILVQSGPAILPQFPPELSAKAQSRLEKLGVEVRLNSRVTGVDANGVTLGDERIASKTVIWTAGVAPNRLVRSLGLPADRGGRVIVQNDCSVPGHSNVFIIGDAASFTPPVGKALPGVAQVALQQGSYVGRLIVHKLAGGALPPAFRYFDKGNLAIIGPFYALMDSFSVRSAGLFAFFVWAFIHIQFLSSALNRANTMGRWVWFLLTRQRVGRVIISPNESKNRPEPIL